jgi:TPP-dependent 2-oxoacid decarboxylase
MNWYKIAQREVLPIAISAYNSDGKLKILFKGIKTYTYLNVSPFEYKRISQLLGYKNYTEVQRILKNLSNNSKKKNNALGLDPDQEQMLEQLEQDGAISPRRKI